jgi:ABC-type tungstate transport system permease subunit
VVTQERLWRRESGCEGCRASKRSCADRCKLSIAGTLEGTELVILVEGDSILFNPYGVMAVNPEKSAEINADVANEFMDWLVSVPTQETIGQFGVDEFGSPLFTPDSSLWRERGS